MKQTLFFIALFAISGFVTGNAFANNTLNSQNFDLFETSSTGAFQVRWTAAQRNAYNSGHSQGENDRRASRTSSPDRASSSSATNVRPYYNQGYMDGYNNIPRRYDFVLGQNPGGGWGGGGNPGGGWGGGNPGWGSGRESTAYWTGSVDKDANIIIQGSSIRVVNVSGNGVTTYQQRMNGSLPRSNTQVSVEKLDGRGNVRVLQQPSRANNYQAIIRINDAAGGADNYRIEVSWTGGGNPGWGGGNPGWGSGRESTAFWAGSVDKDANIIIQGGSIRAVNVSGNGVTTYQQSVHGSLPNSNTQVSVQKLGGRGNVRVLQQPSRANNYQAIIRINDAAGGADNYSIEVSWTGGGPGWGGGGPGWGGGNPGQGSGGSATWSGRVDNTVNIMLRARTMQTIRINGQNPTNVRYDMTASIPQRQGVTVSVNKRNGRGDVRVIQQPTQYNNYTAIVQIEDRQGGADNYSIDIQWN